jgi:acetolactate synthase-1/3 small subunit
MLRTIATRVASARTPLYQARFLASQSSSSTSAISFKQHIRQRRFGPAPTVPQPSVEDAVTNILYNTPAPSNERETRHVLNCLVHNEPGVLSRVSGILAARGFNIQSLVVANTEVEDLSRMTIIFNGQNVQIEQARRQLEDLVSLFRIVRK